MEKDPQQASEVKEYEVGIAPEHLMIADMDPSMRPREKAMKIGVENLTDAELMAIIFATGIQGKSVLALCDEILSANSYHLSYVCRKSEDMLCQEHKGIGKVKAITLKAALELGKRAKIDEARIAASESILDAKKALARMKHHFDGLQHEEFWVLYLNRAGKAIGEVCISKGGTAATTVDIKIILRYAIHYLAHAMILYHNHPSGNMRPSIEDDRLTMRIVDAAKLIDVRVNDHIIVGKIDPQNPGKNFDNYAYYAYSDHGKI